jgi:hypothetical protein
MFRDNDSLNFVSIGIPKHEIAAFELQPASSKALHEGNSPYTTKIGGFAVSEENTNAQYSALLARNDSSQYSALNAQHC